MSTNYPASVSVLQQARNKGGRPKRSGVGVDSAADGDAVEEAEGVHGSQRNEGLGGVELDFGGVAAAKLDRGHDGWRWTYAAASQDVKLRLGRPALLITAGASLLLSTGVLPGIPAANSLKAVRDVFDKYEHLGVGSSIHPELDALTSARRSGDADRGGYDPFLGHRTVTFRLPHAKLARNLVFHASGRLGDHLRAGILLGNSNKMLKNRPLTRFIPILEPVVRYSTEILQLCVSAAKSPYRADYDAAILAVRLHSNIFMYQVTPRDGFALAHPASPVQLEEVGQLSVTELDGCRVVDMVLDPHNWARLVLVDQRGGVWLWHRERGSGREDRDQMKLQRIRDGDRLGIDPFHRVTFGGRNGTILVVSATEAVMIDLEDPDHHSLPLLSLSGHRAFTSLQSTGFASEYMCLVTSREVVWVDERSPGIPLLSWRHELGDGTLRDLEVTYLPQGEHDCYILSSRSIPTIIMLHLMATRDLRSVHPPYSISFDIDSRLKPLASITLINLSAECDASEPSWAMLATAKDGSVWTAAVGPAHVEERAALRLDIKEQVSAPVLNSDDIGVSGETRYTVMDARWAWLEINKDPPPADESTFTPDEFARFLRELDAPFDHFTTAAELARDAVLPESDERRRSLSLRQVALRASLSEQEIADFSAVDVARDLHLVQNIRIQATDIDGHLNEADVISNLKETHQALAAAFPDRADVSPGHRRKQRKAIDSLALDLTLSSTVVSSEPISVPLDRPTESADQTDEDVLARAAGLTLSETAPPHIRFSILLPRVPVPSQIGQKDDAAAVHTENVPGASALQTPTARSLLAEWDIGADPSAYTWKPWIITDAEAIDPALRANSVTDRPIRPLPSPRPGSPRFPDKSANYPASSQPGAHPSYWTRPSFPVLPIVPIVQTQPQAQPQPHVLPAGAARASSPPFGYPTVSQGDSQDAWAATQVERGPFGGRGAERKKKVKKHVGGF